ncbi:MAG: hypothetical protein IIV03_03100, partial [Clostridia bacterium]|nr:hypothetical protein [Clostridia bacterium]
GYIRLAYSMFSRGFRYRKKRRLGQIFISRRYCGGLCVAYRIITPGQSNILAEQEFYAFLR